MAPAATAIADGEVADGVTVVVEAADGELTLRPTTAGRSTS